MMVSLSAIYGAPHGAEEAPQDDDPLAEHMNEAIRCRRCGQAQTRNEWCDGAAEGCKDQFCPMQEYEP